MLHLLSLSDGKTTLVEIAEKCSKPIWSLFKTVEKLQKHKLIKISKR